MCFQASTVTVWGLGFQYGDAASDFRVQLCSIEVGGKAIKGRIQQILLKHFHMGLSGLRDVITRRSIISTLSLQSSASCSTAQVRVLNGTVPLFLQRQEVCIRRVKEKLFSKFESERPHC